MHHRHLLFLAAVGASARFTSSFPSATPAAVLAERQTVPTASAEASSLTPDPWQCVTESVGQYLDSVPKPTGALLTNINSYGDEVVKPCKATATGLDFLSCTVSDPKSWCGFATAAPSSVRADYSSYVAAAVSYWEQKSAKISVLSTSCAVAWARQGPADKEWLKIATAHAQCFLAAHPATSTSASTSASTTLSKSATAKSSTASTASTATPSAATTSSLLTSSGHRTLISSLSSLTSTVLIHALLS